MRDPNRIHEVLQYIEKLWMTVPDWRFMQLMNNLQSSVGHDMFYTEDEQLAEIIGSAKAQVVYDYFHH